MSFLRVFNPSDYCRNGPVTTPWQPIEKSMELSSGRLAVYDESGTRLRMQIDRAAGRDELSFLLESSIPSRDEHYQLPAAFVDFREEDSPNPFPSQPEPVVLDNGFKLRNERLEIWFNLVPTVPEYGPGLDWFAGCATSVQLDGREVLDDNWWLEHDREKRVLQVDKLILPRPAWSTEAVQEVPLFRTPFQVVATSAGPVRSTVAIVSDPFAYDYADLATRQSRRLACRFHRVLSLYAGADYLVEEMWLEAHTEEGGEPIPLQFQASYFHYTNWSGGLVISRFENVPDWFAVTSRARRFFGYGFATDVHAYSPVSPAPNFPNPEKAGNSLSWSLHPCKRARCLHAFLQFQPDDSSLPDGMTLLEAEHAKALSAIRANESRAGHDWYETIYKPLMARV
jgi:hypothetical protein